jgi:tetratricopeptide (TPR) repeat protein
MKRLCFVTLLFVLLAFPSGVRADIAPPIEPSGSNPQPGAESTQVRMLAETVVIEVQRDITPESLGRARVTADFTMQNLGSADERMAVRFPISASDGQGNYPEISNVQIQVNGKRVQHRRTNYPDKDYPNGNIPWAEFDVAFPVGQDVPIRVAYELKGSGYYPYTAFYYILETGAGWKDTIGSADLILRLPYEASPQNVVIDFGIGWATTPIGGVFKGNEVRWHFEEFEPGWDQNMEFALVAPSRWQSVLTARENAAKHPNDGEAWGMLGKAYKEIFFMSKAYREDAGGLELYQLSIEAYEKCLSLKPEDAQWHAGFADLLASHVMWRFTEINENPETYRALEEINTALELAPNDPVVREIALKIGGMLSGSIEESGGRFEIPWLTQTPTPWQSLTPAAGPVDDSTATPPATLAPTATSEPQAAPTQTDAPEANPTPTPERSSPFCGSAAFLPLIAVAWFVWKRR